MAASLIGKMIWKGTKWVAKKAVKRRKAKALKKAQSPSKLSKKVTKHSKAQKVRAQIADPKKKFPSAKKIKESGIKLKYLDPKRSRKGISQVRPKKQKQKWHIPKVSKARKAELKERYGDRENIPLIEVSPQYSQHVDKVFARGAVGTVVASAAGAKIGSELTKKKKIKKNKRANPYRQKKPVRGIQLGAPGTQSGTSRSKKGY